MDGPQQELKFCENCKKDVSAVNFLMHNAHCQRNISLCEMCKEPFPKNEIAAHIADAHSKVKCARCGKEVEQQNVQQHNTHDCTKRLVKCGFCDIEVQASDQSEHEDYCGSRTERCDECGQYVMLKYRDIHVSSNHSFLTIEDYDKQHSSTTSSASMYSGMKNFNTSKDDKEPLSVRSHYSPGKRTNDMPQINVNASLGQLKETSKPILRDLYESQSFAATGTPSGLSIEQWDRLLAMHLTEDDTLSPSYANSDPEEAILTSRDVTGSGAFLPAEDFDDIETMQDNDLNGRFGFPAQWQTRLGAGEGLERESGGILPVSRLIKPPEDEVCLALPCEFCNELYSADQLLEHQRFCEFTTTMRNNPATTQTGEGSNIADRLLSADLNNSKNVEKNRKEATSIFNNFMKTTNAAPPRSAPIDKDVESVIIPCEYCGTPFDSEYIIEHESGCGGFLEEMSPAQHTPVPAPAIVNRETRSTPTLAPVIKYGDERQLGEDPQIDYLDDLFLKEAIENSLKDKNVSSEAPPPQLASRSPKVRQIPINVEPGYSPRRRMNDSTQPTDEEVNALNRMRAAKAQHTNKATPLTATRRFEQPSPNDQQLNSYPSNGSGEAMPANNPTNPMDPTGARPKSFARRSDVSPAIGESRMEPQEDARNNERHIPNQQRPPPVTPIPRLRDQIGPRGARPSSTPATNPRQVKSKQPQY